MKFRLIFIGLVLTLSACNIAVTSFPAPQPLENPELSPTPYPDTPAPETIDASVVKSPALIGIQFFTELDGWGVAEFQIVRTNDGGITWYNVTPPDVTETDSPITAFILDRDHAWAQKPDFNNYPNNGLLYRTTDGGMNWTISSTPFSGGDLSFTDVNNGWMLADLGVGAGSNAVAVFQTMDGGTTWTQTYTNDPNVASAGDSLPLSGLKADLVPLSGQAAWITGVIYASGATYFYRTNDGGHVWSEAALQLPKGVENDQLSINKDQMKLVSSTDGFLAVQISTQTGEYTTQTAVYVTHDAGNTWTLTPTLIPGSGSSDFLSAQEAILYNGEQFYVTRDAAQTWTIVSPNIVFGDSFAAMDFVNPETGWIITLDGSQHRSLYHTTDGGATWLSVIP